MPLYGPYVVVQIAAMLIKHHRWEFIDLTSKLCRKVRCIFNYFVQHFSFKLAVIEVIVVNRAPRLAISDLEIAEVLREPEKLIILLKEDGVILVNTLY